MEIILGRQQQKLQVSAYLAGLRTYLPMEEFSKKTVNTRFSKWLEEPDSSNLIDLNLFNEITNSVEVRLQRFDPQYRNLPFDRYVVGQVDIANSDIGGFNSKYSRGFKYLSNWGFAALLNRRYTGNPIIMTIELARSYLHDSMHSASFRTIRWLQLEASSKFPVYREQYGFNFRKANGVSYSASYSPEQAPGNINLNLLMDGIVVITTGKELKSYIDRYRDTNLNEFEKIILSDIEIDLSNLPNSYKGKGFHEQVTVPSQKFIEYWGGEPLYDLLMRGMLTGKIKELTQHFDVKLSTRKAWPKLFKAQTFK